MIEVLNCGRKLMLNSRVTLTVPQWFDVSIYPDDAIAIIHFDYAKASIRQLWYVEYHHHGDGNTMVIPSWCMMIIKWSNGFCVCIYIGMQCAQCMSRQLVMAWIDKLSTRLIFIIINTLSIIGNSIIIMSQCKQARIRFRLLARSSIIEYTVQHLSDT